MQRGGGRPNERERPKEQRVKEHPERNPKANKGVRSCFRRQLPLQIRNRGDMRREQKRRNKRTCHRAVTDARKLTLGLQLAVLYVKYALRNLNVN